MHESPTEILPTLNPEQLKAREGMESNPANYSVECYPKDLMDKAYPNPTDKLKRIVSGFIDFRNSAGLIPDSSNDEHTSTEQEDSSNKNTIWLGQDHYEIAFNGAKFHEGLNTKDYIIAIKTKYDAGRRQLRIVDELIGQSCDRDPEHIKKIIEAANIAMNRDLVEYDPKLQEFFFLEDYGFGQSADISDRRTYIEGIIDGEIPTRENTDQTVGTYDLVLLSAMDGHKITDSAFQEELLQKIEHSLSKLSEDQKASVRIPFSMETKTDNPDELYEVTEKIRVFAQEFEAAHGGKYCGVNITRHAHKTDTLPEQTWGVLIIGNDN